MERTCTGSLGLCRSILEVGSASLSAPTTLSTSEMRTPRKDFMARTLNVFTLYHCIRAPELRGPSKDGAAYICTNP